MTTNNSVTLGDFCPYNRWEIDYGSGKVGVTMDEEGDTGGEYKFIVDATTGRRYLNETPGSIRFECLLLSLATPSLHLVASIHNIAYRFFRIPMHFISEKEGEYDFTARLSCAGLDLLRIVATPFAIIGLELAALYGIVNPYDGRKLYATIERALYGDLTTYIGKAATGDEIDEDENHQVKTVGEYMSWDEFCRDFRLKAGDSVLAPSFQPSEGLALRFSFDEEGSQEQLIPQNPYVDAIWRLYQEKIKNSSTII